MPALQIRDVPEDVRDQLAAQARERGQSLQAYLLALVVEEARRQRNVEIMSRFDDRGDGAYFSPGEAAADVESVRSERDTMWLPTQAGSDESA